MADKADGKNKDADRSAADDVVDDVLKGNIEPGTGAEKAAEAERIRQEEAAGPEEK